MDEVKEAADEISEGLSAYLDSSVLAELKVEDYYKMVGVIVARATGDAFGELIERYGDDAVPTAIKYLTEGYLLAHELSD